MLINSLLRVPELEVRGMGVGRILLFLDPGLLGFFRESRNKETRINLAPHKSVGCTKSALPDIPYIKGKTIIS